uniref:Protein kinase domain-containing protein n=1 Tax=Panagrolaimus davidi TaxID=227884 RepID=A0A914PPR6_9BILA
MAKNLFRQIVTAVHYLHSNEIAHCGLNPTSIMVDSNGIVKINDSGLGPLCLQHSLMERDYIAPEAIDRSNNNYDGFKADMYSLGIIFRYIINESDAPMTPECQNLFEKLTNEKEFLRPSTGAILKHKWLA